MKLKTIFATLLAVGAMVSAQATVTATTTLTFDDIPAAEAGESTNLISVLAPNYGGLSWDNVYVLSKDYLPGTGYDTGTVSGLFVGYNGYSSPASFSDGTAFSFLSVYVTRAWSAGSVTFTGYLGGVQTQQSVISATTSGPVFATFNWGNVDKVTFASDSQAVIDNLTVGAMAAPVPEPETYAMLLAGLGLMGAVARRRKQAASQ